MESVPLEKKMIPSPKPGVERLVPALNRDWVEPREWMAYQRPPVGKDIGVLGARDAWMERSSFVLDDLEFLLCLPHHIFWSYVIYDVELAKKLSRLLTMLPRQHDMFTPHPDPRIAATLCDLHKATFSVFLRMSSHKESPENFITASAYGKLIYDNFVFDIAKIMDICTLFFLGNPLLVRKMIENLFTCQPAYHQDLQKASVTIAQALEKCLLTVKDTMVFTCTTVPEERRLCDVITYAVDTIVSVSNLVNVYEKAAESLENNLYQPLLELYESGLVPLQAYIRDQNVLYGLSKERFDFLLPLVMHARLSTILIYRSFISNNCIKPLMESEQKELFGEEFWKLMSNMLSEPTFLRDYNAYFAVQDDLDLFAQAGCEIDLIRVQYLNEALKMAGEEIYKKLSKQEQKHREELLPESYAASVKTNTKQSPKHVAKQPKVDMDKLVGQVRDLLPDLGDGFIQMCLKYYDHNPELVIHAILEENLPPHLIVVDRQLQAQKEKEPAPSRFNVHDGDEFDVNTNDTIDKNKVRLGKKNLNSKSSNALLNNKTDLIGLKDHFAALSIVSDIVYGDSLEYEDEYDDTYDDNAIGEREPDDEMTERRPFVTPRVLRGKNDEVYSDGENDKDKEKNGPTTSKPDDSRTPFDFARNPEEIRAEADRKRQAKMARRGIPVVPPTRDVVGAAKGHGQSQQVLNNRARKTENKGKHHRAMADRKMAKGMF